MPFTPSSCLRCSASLAAVLCLVLACALASATAPAPSNRLPALGDPVSESFDVGTERRLGEHIMAEIWRDPDYLDDPVLQAYLQSLWQPLLTAARQRGDIGPELDERLAWHTFLVRDRSVNAFALPGGYVGVHLGLIALTGSSDELAAVLGHELSHITQRHIGRSMAHARQQSLLSVASVIVGVLAASRSSRTDGAQAVIAGGQALAIQGQLNFSRDMEREADRIGAGVLSDAGFSPAGMATMFEKLEHSARLNDSGGFPYLRSHPLTSERIGEARARGSSQSAPSPSTLQHALAQARARVLMDTRSIALKRWQTSVAAPSASASEHLMTAYASALASSRLHDHERARRTWQSAQDRVSASAAHDREAQQTLALLGAELALARSDPSSARDHLAPYRNSRARPVMLLTAQAALHDLRELVPSAESLQTWLTQSPLDASAWQTLSQIWQALRQPLRALRAEAESKAAIGDYLAALDRLRAAQRHSAANADPIEAAVITARLRNFETLRRRQVQDHKEG
jgi:beta-barrel assembly-enhancing protease